MRFQTAFHLVDTHTLTHILTHTLTHTDLIKRVSNKREQPTKKRHRVEIGGDAAPPDAMKWSLILSLWNDSILTPPPLCPLPRWEGGGGVWGGSHSRKRAFLEGFSYIYSG